MNINSDSSQGWSKIPNRTLSERFLYFLFFLSGFTALLYQVCWQRILLAFSGSDIHSITIVISAFLAGLGIGSWSGGKLANRLTRKQSLLAYGLIELAVAAFAIISPFLFYEILYQQYFNLGSSNLFVAAILFLCLLIPTMLMGSTLPLLSKAFISNASHAAITVSYLNAVNILGAAIGSLIAGWLLIGNLGYDNTIYAGSTINVAIGVFFIFFSTVRSRGETSTKLSVDPVNFSEASNSKGSGLSKIWCALFFLSGFMAISLEIIWFRILDVALSSISYTFSYLLFCFLLFDGLGIIYGTKRLKHIQNHYKWFLHIQALITAYAAISILAIIYFHSGEMSYPPLPGYFILTPFIVAPPAFLIGMSFPIVQAAVKHDLSSIGQNVGLLQTANIAGNTLAGVITGLVLFEHIGTNGALQVILGLGSCFCLTQILTASKNDSPEKTNRGSYALLALLILAILYTPDNNRFWRGVQRIPKSNTAFFKETSAAINTVVTSPETDWALVMNNGKGQGSIPYIGQHLMLGAIPALLHDNPQKILVIGLGSSGTAFGVGINDFTRQIDVIEISAGNLSLITDYISTYHRDEYFPMFMEDRYHFMEGDGRKFVGHTSEHYDIIEMDAIQPNRSGSGLLYSREFFLRAAQKLNHHGFVALWLPTKRAKATFIQTFPYGVALSDLIYIGSMQPLHFDFQKLLSPEIIAKMSARLSTPPSDMEMILKDYATQDNHVYWDPTNIPLPFKSIRDINTDLFPRDEYFLQNPY